MDTTRLNEAFAGTFASLIGLRFTVVEADRLEAELVIRDDLRTAGGTLHGGVLMSLADTLGAAASMVSLREGQLTTTLESKTNFFDRGRAGLLRARSSALHRGRRTQVWETRIEDQSARLLSLTIQTQMVLEG